MSDRGPGRPPGSINRLTQQWSAYINAAYGSPLDIAARAGAMSPAEIANEVGCDLITAQKLRQTSWEFTAKYTHSEMPRAVAVEAAVADTTGLLPQFLAPAFLAALASATALHDDDVMSSSPNDRGVEGRPHAALELPPRPPD
jgi:hypothetical protein